MDSDEVLEKIGSYGLFQKRNTLLLGLIIFILSFQTVLMVFVGAEPAWRCAPGRFRCTANGSFAAGQDFYKARCDMNRSDWEFTPGLTSIITEVSGDNDAVYPIRIIEALIFALDLWLEKRSKGKLVEEEFVGDLRDVSVQVLRLPPVIGGLFLYLLWKWSSLHSYANKARSWFK